MKENKNYKNFEQDASEILADGRLKIVAPNTGMELTFDEAEDKFIIINAGENCDKTKKYASLEKAIDYLLLND